MGTEAGVHARAAETAALPDRRASLRAALQALHAGRHADASRLSAPFAGGDDIEARLLHGLALGGLGEAGASARLLCEIAREKPQILHPCQDLSTILTGQGRADDAEPVYRAALDLTPNDPRLLLSYGEYLAGRWRPEEAEAVLRQALRVRPGDLAAMNQLGIVLAALGRMEEALAIFRDVVATNPANHAAWANLGCALAHE